MGNNNKFILNIFVYILKLSAIFIRDRPFFLILFVVMGNCNYFLRNVYLLVSGLCFIS